MLNGMQKRLRWQAIACALLLLVAILLYWSQAIQCLSSGRYTVQSLRIDQQYTFEIDTECDLESVFESTSAHYIVLKDNGRILFGPVFLEAWDKSSVDYLVVGAESGPVVGVVNSKRPTCVLVVFNRATGDVLSRSGGDNPGLWKQFLSQTGTPAYVFVKYWKN